MPGGCLAVPLEWELEEGMARGLWGARGGCTRWVAVSSLKG